jgi:HK97 family phage major capsid protein
MQLKLSEFKSHVEKLKTLTGEARAMVLGMLKSAKVVDDVSGAELDVELIESSETKSADQNPASPATPTATTSADAIQKMVDDAIAKKIADDRPAPKAVNQPLATKGLPAGVKRGGSLKNFRADRNGVAAEVRAGRFGMYCIATLGNGPMSQWAKAWCDANGMEFKVATENVNSTSAFLVPEEFSQDLIDLREQYGVFRRQAKIRRMTSDTLTVPRRVSGLTAYAYGEGQAGTESQKVWDQVRLVAKDWMVITRYTNQLSADAVINIGDDLAGEIAYAFANKEDLCGFMGDGSSPYAGIQGVLPRLLNVWGATGVGTSGGTAAGLRVATGTGYATNYNSITLADFNAVVGMLPQFADTPNAAWYMHKTFWGTVAQKLETAAGGNRVGDITDGARTPKFLGYPVIISQVLPKTSALSQVCCVLGDLSLAASFGDRQQDAIAMSEHASVGGQSVFERNELAVRGTERFDIVVHDVGDGASIVGPMVGLVTASS